MRKRILALAALVIGFSSLSLYSQSKVAVVDTEAFTDAKDGVKRLVTVLQQIDAEFKPRRDELAQMQAKYDQLVKDINDTRNVADQKVLATKADQAEQLKIDIERKQGDGQKALDKRIKDATGPIYQDVGKALGEFAKQKGYDLVFDLAKLENAVMLVNDGIDITAAFVADYNAKNPVPAAPKP